MEYVQIRVSPDQINDTEFQKKLVAEKLKLSLSEIQQIKCLKRSLDARGKPLYSLRLAVYLSNEKVKPSNAKSFESFKKVAKSKLKVVIIGSGPAGLFAALELIKKGVKPVILERGKDVRSRRRDLTAIQKKGAVNPDSNYCFGEGGAGTYSDGKLYTRTRDKKLVNEILRELVSHGAQEEILIESHPHIGTNKLPKVIEEIRKTILNFGGEINFDHRVVDFKYKNNSVYEVICQNGESYSCDAMILATGHSARDVYEMLIKKGLSLEAKPFALGVRVEHPQELVDQSIFKIKNGMPRHENLPAAAYDLVFHHGDRSVYSFCMCPGGFIVPAATAESEVVVNGMSPSKRDSPFANSGIVVSILEKDLKGFEKYGAMAGVFFQESFENKAYLAGGSNIKAPAQRVNDFIKGKLSTGLPDCSYRPGLKSFPMDEIFDGEILDILRLGLKSFEKKIRGFCSQEGVILAVESRTSSPVRIPRDKDGLFYPDIENLYPCGEGAGYAGGIISAAMDGVACARSFCLKESLKIK